MLLLLLLLASSSRFLPSSDCPTRFDRLLQSRIRVFIERIRRGEEDTREEE